MDRLREAESHLKELLNSDLEQIFAKERIELVAKDVVQLLSLLRVPSSPPLSPKSLSPKSTCSNGSAIFLQNGSLQNGSLQNGSWQNFYHPTPSSSSRPDDSENKELIHLSAHDAFNQEIYARCVQIVENVAKRNHLDMELTFLAHLSYQRMVENAENLENAKKFANFWIQFLENNRRFFEDVSIEYLQYLECLVTALEKRYEIDESCRKEIGRTLLSTLITLNQKSQQNKPLLASTTYWNSLRKWSEDLKPLLEETDEWQNALSELSCFPELEILYDFEVNKERFSPQNSVKNKFPPASSEENLSIIHF